MSTRDATDRLVDSILVDDDSSDDVTGDVRDVVMQPILISDQELRSVLDVRQLMRVAALHEARQVLSNSSFIGSSVSGADELIQVATWIVGD